MSRLLSALADPARLRTSAQASERKVTWLELFFDLVFVAAVAQVAAPLGGGDDLAGLGRFALFLLMIWWAWLGHTTFSTRFDGDDLLHRTLTLLQLFFATVMAVNAEQGLDSPDSAGFAAAYAAMRLLLAAEYLRALRVTDSRPLSRCYLVGCALAATLWLLSAVAPVPLRYALWAVAFAIDFATPLIAERHSPAAPPHASHLPERYGLFTIILLGESVAAVMHGMERQAGWSPSAVTSAIGSLGITFAVWWLYFEGVRGAAERRVRTVGDGVRLRLWSYAHLPLYVGVVIAGVGLEHAIEAADQASLHTSDAWMLSAAVGATLAAITTVFATSDGARCVPHLGRALALRYLLAAAVVGVGVAGDELSPPVFVSLLAAGCLAQVRLTRPLAHAAPELEKALPELA
jgi:low temperature requirement protein LtrA